MNVKFKIGLKANLPKTGIVEGTWYLAKDAGELYYGDASNQMVLVDASNNLKNITITAGSGLQGGGSITSAGTSTTISHKSVSTTESGSGEFIADIQFDEFGHVTSITRTDISLSDLGVTASATELNYVKGVTSSIQTQLNGKASTSSIPAAATVAPKAPGTATVGTSTKYAREDHIHPTDTTRASASTTITAGTGLTGGGSLSANRTISHQAKPEEGEDAGGIGSFVTGVTIDDLGHVVSTTKGNAPSLTGGSAATSGQYVSGVTVSGHAVTVTKAALPTTISGNAGTATKLATARTISLSGDVTGSTTFDGSDDVSITATVADDSHNHVISNVDGLQTALNAKAPLASPALTGTPTAPTAAASTNNTQVATTAFVKTAVNSAISGLDGAMVFKGTIGSTGATVTALPNSHTAGWTYVVATAGTYAGEACEVGDMITCVKTGTAASNADWNIVQNNINGAVTGPASAVDSQVAVFNGSTGKIIKAVNASTLSVGSASTASSATTATNLASAPSLAASGNNITVTAGGKTSATFTVPYATSAGSASSATNATNWTEKPDWIGSSKPTYTASEVGALASGGTAVNASKVANALILKVNSGTTEGTNLYTFNGSAAKTLDIKAGNNVTLTAAAGSLTISSTNKGTVTSVATGVGLTGGTITSSGTLKAKLRSETALTIDSVAGTTTSGRVYPVAVDKTGYLAVNVPWTDTNTNTTYTFASGTDGFSVTPSGGSAQNVAVDVSVSNSAPTLSWGATSTIGTVSGTALTVKMPANPNTDTHYTASLVTSTSATGTSNAVATSPYLNLVENGTIRNSHRISGSGATTVTSDASGNITISSTDTNTDTKVTSVGNHYTPSGGTTTSASGGSALTAGSSQVVTGITKDAAGHVTGITSGRLPAAPTLSGLGGIDTVNASGALSASKSGTTVTVSHSTAAGYHHIPAGGSSGQYLKWSSAGVATWAAGPTSSVTFKDGYSTSASGSDVTISGDGVVDAILDSSTRTYNLTWARPSYIQGYAKTITVNGTSFTVNASDRTEVSITTGGMSYSSYSYTSTSLTIEGGTCRYPSSYSNYSHTLKVSLTGFSSSKSDTILVVYGTRTVSFSSNSNLIKISDIPTTGSSSSTYRIYAFQYLGGKIAVNCAEYTA